MLHILVGQNDLIIRLQTVARTNESVRWIVPKNSHIGDDVLLFIPQHGIVGRAEITSSPRRTKFGSRPAYGASIRPVEMLPTPVRLALVVKRFPEWKWATYPRSYTSVESDFGSQLVSFLDERG